jgi:hypothetical protein
LQFIRPYKLAFLENGDMQKKIKARKFQGKMSLRLEIAAKMAS